MSDMFVGSQAPIYQNVCITRRSKNGKILEQRFAKNRVTRLMLYGIGKFLLGHFNNSTPDKIYEYIPRYLALGTNTPGPDASIAGVGRTSSVNDTRLLNEITQSSTNGISESVKRIWIAERNMCKLNTKFSDPFIKVSIKTYVSSNHYDGMDIGEAGLFSKEKNNNCLARVCFPTIRKNPNEVLDIQWDITLLSYGETKYPESISIENGSKIVLPLKYTNRFFKEIPLGLFIDPINRTIGSPEKQDLFKYNADGIISANYTNTEYKQTDWYVNCFNRGLESIFDTLLTQIINSKLNDVSNPYYLIDVTQNIPNLYHFGKLYTSIDDEEIISTSELCVTLLYIEDFTYEKEETGWKYLPTEKEGSYIVFSPNNNSNDYRIINNRFYKRSLEDASQWIETNGFLYNGVIVDINQEETGYSYSNGKFYKITTIKSDTITNQYLNYSNTINNDTLLIDEKKYIYKYDIYGNILRTEYSIDFDDDKKIYLNDNYTDYHLSVDNYWVTGDYEKLIPVISPKDATDRSVTWFIQNSDIAKINWDGIVTAWNLGETTAIATTSNDLRAKCIIEVVKESKYIDVDSITLDPSEITLIVDGDANQYYTVVATVLPLFATNTTVTWSMTNEISNCISLINLGDNKIKVVLNGTGNIGTGYITATSQSGKSAECLVRVIYSADSDNCDCPDISHLQQEA